jgi:hypothetical protein
LLLSCVAEVLIFGLLYDALAVVSYRADWK